MTIAEMNGLISGPIAVLSGTIIVALGALLLKRVVEEPSVSYSLDAFLHRLLRFSPGFSLLIFGAYIVYVSVVR